MAYNPYYPLGNQTAYGGIPTPWNYAPYGQSGIPATELGNRTGMTNMPIQRSMEWVDGEVGAKAYQMPIGLEPNKPIPLWDSTDMVIYLKSWNQMGMPNPMQKLKYVIEEPDTPVALAGNSGSAQQSKPEEDTNLSNQAPEYATKEDFENLRDELRSMLSSRPINQQYGNQNGGKSMNQGGNRG